VVYNTFPLPALSAADKTRLDGLAQKVLDGRAAFPDSSLADLYDRLTMPPALHRAHQALDAAVDALYRPQPFADDRERAEHLLVRCEALTAGLKRGTLWQERCAAFCFRHPAPARSERMRQR
jgi:hypothetical protein